MCDTLVKRQQRPWLASDAVFRFSEYGIKQRKCLKILHGFTKKVKFLLNNNPLDGYKYHFAFLFAIRILKI